jgi:hypothetical protein
MLPSTLTDEALAELENAADAKQILHFSKPQVQLLVGEIRRARQEQKRLTYQLESTTFELQRLQFLTESRP